MKKKGKLLLFFLLGSLFFLSTQLEVEGTPASDEINTYSQPSGEHFSAQLVGDEQLNYLFSNDTGDILSMDEDNYWHYSKLKDQKIIPLKEKYLIDQKPIEALTKKDVSALNKVNTASSKTARVFPEEDIDWNQKQPLLLVLIEFADEKLVYSDSEWEKRVFSTTNKSLNTYYKEATNNKIDVIPAKTKNTSVSGVVRIKLDRNHPKAKNNFKVAQETAKEAFEKLGDYIDLKSYDTDNNGFISENELHIMGIFAGYENSTIATPNSVWGHRTNFGNYSDIGYPDINGMSLFSYTLFGEKSLGKNGKDTQTSLGLIAHEFGHDLLLPDLYVADKTVINTEVWSEDKGIYELKDVIVSNGAGLGKYSIMGSGSWNSLENEQSGSTPAHFDAYCKVLLGVTTPIEVTSPGQVEVPTIKSGSPEIYKVNSDIPSQFLLIENRQFEGFDQSLNTSIYTLKNGTKPIVHSGGIAIYKVNTANKNNNHYDKLAVSLLEADEGILGYSLLKTPSYYSVNNYDGFYYQGMGANNTAQQTTVNRSSKPSSQLNTNGNYAKFDISIDSPTKDSMKVTFSKPTIPVESVKINQPGFEFYVGEQKKLSTTVTPENATNQEIEWRSSDPDRASVDENGIVTALRVGEAEIIAKVKGTDQEAVLKVTMNERNVFGTVEWEYSYSTGVLSFVSEGEFPSGKTIGNDLVAEHRIFPPTKIKFEKPVYLAENSSALFGGAGGFQIEGLDKVNTSKVKDMSLMFYATHGVELTGLEAWDTSNVVDMSNMFMDTSIPELNLAKWDTSNVETMSGMFSFSVGVKKLELGNWNTSKVKDMSGMFVNTMSLKKVDAAKWDTSNVQNMSFMFANTDQLDTLALGAKSIFSVDSGLSGDTEWRCEENNISYESSSIFMQRYDGSAPGIYVRKI